MNRPEQADDWESCPAGEIGRLVDRLKAGRRAQRTRQAAMVASALVLLLAGGVVLFFQWRPSEPNYGGITCSEVRKVMKAFLAGELDAGLRRRVDAHLAECTECRRLFEQMQRQRAGDRGDSSLRHAPRRRLEGTLAALFPQMSSPAPTYGTTGGIAAR